MSPHDKSNQTYSLDPLHRQIHVAATWPRGLLRAAAGEIVNVQSAGSNPAGQVHPLAIKVMAEAGVDISGHRSKHLKEFLDQPVHTVITVCGNVTEPARFSPAR